MTMSIDGSVWSVRTVRSLEAASSIGVVTCVISRVYILYYEKLSRARGIFLIVFFLAGLLGKSLHVPYAGPNLYRLPRKQRDCELGIGVSQAHVALRPHRAPDELGGPCGVGLPLD